MITIPDVKGKSLREAKNRFDDWGLRYDQVKEVNSFNTEKGKVIKTEPAIGTQVNYGDLITIYVSKRKTYPVVIVLVALLLLGLLLGKGTISKLINSSKKPQQQANVCLINCDTNGDGIPDTNLDTDGDGKCDQNCDGNVEQNGDGTSTDGKGDNKPKEEGKKSEGTPTVRVVTENQGGQTVVRVAESKNATSLKYSDGKQSIEYFTNGGGTPVQLGQYVIIGNSGTITIYAGNGSGGTTHQIDAGNGGSDPSGGGNTQPEEDPIPTFTVTAPSGYSNQPVVTISADASVYKMKVLKGDKDIDDVKADGREITGKTSYTLCSPDEDGNLKEKECSGTWTFAAWSKTGRGITETVTFKKFDNTPPTLKLTGDLDTPKRVIGVVIEADDNKYTGQVDYFNIFYTNGKRSGEDMEDLPICQTSTIDNCKMRLVNGEHLGITNPDTYTFIVYDQAGNYTNVFNCNDSNQCTSNLTIDADKIISELTPPKFILDDYGWSTSKTVTIQYPEGWGGEYSLDGGETFQNYMDPITFNDDGERHEIIARVMSGTEAVASSSIVVTKIDNVEPTMDIGLSKDGKFGVGKDKTIPSATNKDQIKSGTTIECKYGVHGEGANTPITNLKNITDIGYYDFSCTMTTGTGKTVTKEATNVEGFEPISIVFKSLEGSFSDEECSKDGQSCNEQRNELTRGIKKGQQLGADPVPERDGYKFAAWKTDDGKYSSSSFVPQGDMTYSAVWNPWRYKIKWNANGGIYNNGTEEYSNECPVGNIVSFPGEAPGKSGYTFYGWWTEQEGGTKVTETTTKPTASTTYYAHWIKTEGKFNTFVNNLYSNIGDQVGLVNTGGAIRYTGPNPNNYVRISPNGTTPVTYRIIGLFDINGTKLLKLVTATSYELGTIDPNGAKFGESALKNTLNNLAIAADDRVATVTWKYDSVDYLTKRYSDALSIEKNASDSFTAKVAIPYITDYGYSAKNFQDALLGNSYNSASNAWMMTMVGSVNTFVLDKPVSDGYLVHTSGHFYDTVNKNKNNTIYYTFFLTSNAEVYGGTGTRTDPYILK